MTARKPFKLLMQIKCDLNVIPKQKHSQQFQRPRSRLVTCKTSTSPSYKYMWPLWWVLLIGGVTSLPASSCLGAANGSTAVATGYPSAFGSFSEKHLGCSALTKTSESSFIPGKQESGFAGLEIRCRCGSFTSLSWQNQQLKEFLYLQ